MLDMKKIGIIGAGSMSHALIKGLINSKVNIASEHILVTNKNKIHRLHYLKETYGVNITGSNKKVALESDIIIIAVKPNDVKDVLNDIGSVLTQNQLLISVAAGITTEYIEKNLENRVAVIRAMPNTSCHVNESATALAEGKWCKTKHLEMATEIFSSVGRVLKVKESAIDAITGLSGSGPAYVYLLMEGLIEAGIVSGLSRKESFDLAVQTVLGAAKMARETGEEPTLLRKKVTSPNGTTEAGIKVLEQKGFKESLILAVQNAANRSKELSKMIE
jgi:pyrroline-5-carboxylate reductase